MKIAIVVFVVLWIWCAWEAWNTPLMPDEYNEDGINSDYTKIDKDEYRDE